MIDIRSFIKQFFLIGAVGLSFVVSGAQALVISASGTNTSIGSAQNLDDSFSLEYDHLIESSQTLEADFSVTKTNDSNTIPHVTVNASVTVDQYSYAPPHFYSFHASKDTRGIFDIDIGPSSTLESIFADLWLFDSSYAPLARSNYGLMGPGEVDAFDAPYSVNPFFDYDFGYTGKYYLGVGEYDQYLVDPFDADPYYALSFFFDGDYTLNVSIEDHAVSTPEPSTLLLLGTALAGLGLMRRRKTISVK